jgi:serine kinase of HPr protein (carbohydrate metabolism regulator)
MTLIHASAAIVGERGVLIRGSSGSGKSSLLLALLDTPTGDAWLVADDRVELVAAHGRLVASVPPSIAGLLEIRGRDIAARPRISPARIRLVVDIAPPEDCPRLPQPSEMRAEIAGVILPRLMLPVGASDGARRVRATLTDLHHIESMIEIKGLR